MTASSFVPAWWLRNPHLQTLWGKFFRKRGIFKTSVERLDTPDDDFIDLHHFNAKPGAPVLLILHGLEGGIRSHYIQAFLEEAQTRDWHAVVLIFRGCGDEPNRSRRLYHSGETTDVAFAVAHLQATLPSLRLVLAGVSLGGNVLLKFLGENGNRISSHVKGAAAMSVPYDLARSSRYIDQGFSKVYQLSFLRSLKSKAAAKIAAFPGLADAARVSATRTMFDFDDSFTAPVHGFNGAADYYSQSSAIGWLERISIKTLLLSAVDDPFLPPQVLDEVRVIAAGNPLLHLETPQHGGHVGFVGGTNPLEPAYYMEKRACDFLAHCLDE